MSAPSVRNRTSYQITAATPDASVWVSANAGTGKTGVLVDRISRLLLTGVPPERILCLTFTKAAAAEMANRLADLLSSWSAMDEETLTAELIALGETEIDEDRLARAKRLFAMTLDAPEGLRIRTIHSFCESLLGRFPLEARVSPDFRVMDDRDQRELQREARDAMLSVGDGRGSSLADALAGLAALVDETRFADLMRELDSSRSTFRSALQQHGGVDGLIDATYAVLGVPRDRTTNDVLCEACTLDDDIVDNLTRLCAAWAEGSKTNVGSAEAVQSWLALSPDQRIPHWRDHFAGQFLTAAGALKAERTLMSKGADAFDPGALDLALQMGAMCLEILEQLRAVNTAEATKALVRVGASLIEAYESIKAQRGRLDYDDLIERASMLLSSPGGVSWVHFKLDGGIEHVLVDEAQDTSPDQWRVIEEVASDFFAGKGRYEETSDRPRTVFAVGDEKQSIYSFQGAEPAMFGDMRRRFAARVTAVDRLWKPVEMAESFRSAPAILNIVDKVFDNPDASSGLSFDDKPVRHISARSGQAGSVTVWPKEAPDEHDKDQEPWDAPLDRVAADSPEDRVATNIANTIHRWLETGEVLEAQGRAVQPGDIMILVQKRRRFAELMVAKLKDLNIPVSGRDRMILPDQLAIQDLIALGRLTLLPEDDLNTAVVLKGPLIGLSEEALYDLAHGRDGRLIDVLSARASEKPDFATAFQRISNWRHRADLTPPFEFYSRILNAEGGRAALLGNLGPEAADPIDDFLTAALDYERDHVPSLEGFLHWLETGAAEVKRDLEQGRNEVRVMTVHGAKGLQAEIVFIADACTVPAAQTDQRIHWMDHGSVPVWPAYSDNATSDVRHAKDEAREAALEEYRRLLYVAMTRAKDRLYIAGFAGKRDASTTSWHDMIRSALKGMGISETEETGHLVYSEPQSAPPEGRPLSDAMTEDSTSDLPTWATASPAAEPSPPRPLAPSRPEGEEPPVYPPLRHDDGNRFKRGLMVHALLQTLPDLAPARRRAAALAYASATVHGLDAESRNSLVDETMAIIEAPELDAVFSEGSFAEVPIIGSITTSDGTRVVSGQIDRLVMNEREVIIVDYKTNRPPPTKVTDVASQYLRQMAVYRAALKSVHPEKSVRAVLLWTDGPRWMELPEQLLDRHAP